MASGRELALYHARRANVPDELMLRLVNQESRWNPQAVSPVGARGLGQAMPATWRDPGYGVAPGGDINDPNEQLRFTADYASAMLNEYGGDPVRAMAAYNWGPGNVNKWNGDMSALPAETRNYVQQVALGGGRLGGGQSPQMQSIAEPQMPPSLLDQPASGNSPVTTLADLDLAQQGNKFHPGMALQSLGAAISAGSQGLSAAEALGKIREDYFAEQDAAYAKQREEMQRQAAMEIVGGPDTALGQALAQGMPLEQVMQSYAMERGFQHDTAMQDRGIWNQQTMQQRGFGHDYGMADVGQGNALEQIGARGAIDVYRDERGYGQQERMADIQHGNAVEMAGVDYTYGTARDDRAADRTAQENERDRTMRRDQFRETMDQTKAEFDAEVASGRLSQEGQREFLARTMEAAGDAKGAQEVRQMDPANFTTQLTVPLIQSLAKMEPDTAAAKLRQFRLLSAARDQAAAAGDTTLVRTLEAELFNETKTTTVEGGNINPKPGTLPPSTVAVPDPTHPSGYRAVPIGDSPEEREQMAAEAAKEAGITSSLYKNSTILTALDEAIGQTNWSSAGLVGQLTGGIGGSPAMDLKATILPVVSNIGFDRLQQMRQESPHGGALGSIAVQELEALQATIATLSTDQSPAQLRKNLQTVKDHYVSMVKRIETSNASDAEKREALLAMGMTPDDNAGGDGWNTTGSGVKFREKQ